MLDVLLIFILIAKSLECEIIYVWKVTEESFYNLLIISLNSSICSPIFGNDASSFKFLKIESY